MLLILFPFALEPRMATPHRPVPLLHIISPLSFVPFALPIEHLALAISFVVLPHAYVKFFVVVPALAGAVFDVVHPAALVFVVVAFLPIGANLAALTMT